MPMTIRRQSFKYKDPSTGNYNTFDVIGQNLTYDAEAYGTGKRNNVPVIDGDAAYHNNAEYYMEQAQTYAAAAASSASRFTITTDNNHGLVFNLS